MEQSFPKKVIRGCLLISQPYSSTTYYSVIIAYALMFTSLIFRVSNGVVA
jgi:hypothetical protein